MTIQEIYNTYPVPLNLQEHMMTVAHLASFIVHHWHGEKINGEYILKATLFHDIGNLVVFRLDQKNAYLLAEEQKNLQHWQDIQQEMIQKYSNDDHKATQAILEELGVEQSLREVIAQKSFIHAREIAQSTNWALKILSYADNRTSPEGIVSLDERLNDVFIRKEKYKHRPDLHELIDAARQVEEEIQRHVTQSLTSIPPRITEEEKQSYLDLKVS